MVRYNGPIIRSILFFGRNKLLDNCQQGLNIACWAHHPRTFNETQIVTFHGAGFFFTRSSGTKCSDNGDF